MALTYGFYDSNGNGDRKYNAIQMSSIFDGIIKDGIFMSIGTAMVVKAGSDMTVLVGEGRAWFNHTWTLNDAEMPIEVPQAEVLLNRIDTIVLDIDATVSVRANSIKIIKGTPSSSPVAPTLIRSNDHNQYPLCDIYVTKGVTSITKADITNLVGSSSTPFITGILQTINIDSLIAKWESQWEQWFAATQNNTNVLIDTWTMQWTDFFNAETAEMLATAQEWDNRVATWFDQLQIILDGDTATNLANGILTLENTLGDLTTQYTNDVQTIENEISAHKHTGSDGTAQLSYGDILNPPASLPADGGTSAACSGNSATATKLQTPRSINGTAFDGTQNITITAAPTAHNHKAGDINTGILPVVRGGTGVDNSDSIAEITSRFARSAYNNTSGINTSSILTMADREINYHNNRNPSVYRSLNVCDLIFAREGLGLGDSNATRLSAKAENYPFGIIYAESTQTTSDRRKKDNIISLDIEEAFDLLDKTDVYSFNYKNSPDKLRYGFIAQELDQKFKGSSLEVFYGLCKTPVYKKGDDGTQLEEIEDYTWSIDYSSWVPALVSAVKHLVRENKDKESRLTELEDQILRLRQDIDEINHNKEVVE